MMNLKVYKDKRICVAISGGVDSVVLLHYLKFRAKEDGFFLSAVHCEHGIRGEESLADAAFVKDLCGAWDVPLSIFQEDCPARAKQEKESLETSARNFRYQSFATLFEENKADYIALAHHQNDEAETTLFRLLRGTSTSGIGGMVAVNGKFLRPLLTWSKENILEYAKKEGLSWREDQTNYELEATRNKLRLEILPKLEETVPGAKGNLLRFAELASQDDALLYEYAEKLLSMDEQGGQGCVYVQNCEKKPLFRRACLLALKKLGLEKDYTALHLENAYALQFLQRGAKQTFPKGIEAVKEEGRLRFYKKNEREYIEKPQPKYFSLEGFDGGMYLVSVSATPPKNEGTNGKLLRIDKEKLPANAVFRFREEGDYIRRFGGGRKTLKKFFNEEKLPLIDREYLPVIAQEGGKEVYVVCGVEISERLKITETTKEILYISVKNGLHE